MDSRKIYIRKDEHGKPINVFRHNTIFNLKIEIISLNPNYDLDYSDKNAIGETGLLEIFRINTKTASDLPHFVGRWDEKDDLVDIDINKVETQINNYFKSGEKGYEGHHSKKISNEPRIFLVDVNVPEGNIFTGNISFNIGRGHSPDLFS